MSPVRSGGAGTEPTCMLLLVDSYVGMETSWLLDPIQYKSSLMPQAVLFDSRDCSAQWVTAQALPP